MIRVHKGSDLSLVPVYLPADPAIPAAEVPASAAFERKLTEDRQVLQREKSDDAPTWLWLTAGAVVLACWLLLIGLIGWSLVRLSRARPQDEAESAGSPGTPRFARERETIAV
jgi:hypothetical protein